MIRSSRRWEAALTACWSWSAIRSSARRRNDSAMRSSSSAAGRPPPRGSPASGSRTRAHRPRCARRSPARWRARAARPGGARARRRRARCACAPRSPRGRPARSPRARAGEALVQLVDRAPPVVGLDCSSSSACASASFALVSSSSRSRMAAARCSSIVAPSSRPRPRPSTRRRRSAAQALLERRRPSPAARSGPARGRPPSAQALLDSLLDGRDELGHALGELALADGELAAPLVREPPLLGHVRRERVGLGARDGDAELLRLGRRLLLGRRPDARRASATSSSVRAARLARLSASARATARGQDGERPSRIQATRRRHAAT